MSNVDSMIKLTNHKLMTAIHDTKRSLSRRPGDILLMNNLIWLNNLAHQRGLIKNPAPLYAVG